MRHRPVGLGVQGLADTFTKLWLPFDSEEALKLDYYIHECMNFESKHTSCVLAQELGTYPSYEGSPMSEGLFQRDLWEAEAVASDQGKMVRGWNSTPFKRSQDWEGLRVRIAKHGQRNSLTLANMPTASTSTLTSMSPAFEPHNAMMYKRKDKLGESYVCNYELQRVLMARGLWNADVRDAIFRSRIGSIQEILSIPKHIRDIFKGAYDMSSKVIIDHMLIRGVEIDQAQSMNLFIQTANHQIITQTLFYSWKRGGKNGCYYLRGAPPVDAKKIQLTDPNLGGLSTGSGLGIAPVPAALVNIVDTDDDSDGEVCTMQEGCVVCSS
jgi:ribonucleotide reductase alpha subunit